MKDGVTGNISSDCYILKNTTHEKNSITEQKAISYDKRCSHTGDQPELSLRNPVPGFQKLWSVLLRSEF
jgi:hypothetical protein